MRGVLAPSLPFSLPMVNGITSMDRLTTVKITINSNVALPVVLPTTGKEI